ncbi:hypothetical protein [Natronococcus wangiae]|uniref:hypothetical protein n=1 Tax=Natronococcus wangiae TaxID=3068275 RepID=UPI00273F0F84|nr:hypothetical protein [Natronococcus sp. AD5]
MIDSADRTAVFPREHLDGDRPGGNELTTDSHEGVAQFIDWDRATQEWDEPLVQES